MRRVLITGVAGFIGSHLVDALLERGDVVIGFDNFNTYYDPAIKRANLRQAEASINFKLIEADICDEEAVVAAFEAEKPDVVVHLAARAGVRPSLEDPNLYHRVNVVGSQHILDACRTHPVSHLVFASSSSVYGGSTDVPFTEDNAVHRPVSPYAATKRMNELQAHVYSHTYGVRVSMMRFFTAYGPRQRPDMAIHKFTRMILDGEPIPMFGDGTSARDYTYIDDITQGLLRAVDMPFDYEIFNLGEHHTTKLNELIEIIQKHTGEAAIIKQLPEQPGDVPLTYADITHAKNLLGYAPKIGMDEGIRRYVQWFREHRMESQPN